MRRRAKGRKCGLHLHDTGTDDTWPYALADSIWSFADAAPHAPAADAWPFPGADAAPHARADNTADAWSFARADAAPHTRADDVQPFAGADTSADACPNDGQGCLVCDAGGHRRD